MNEPKLERCPMTDAEIIHIFENSRLQSEYFTQEALTATYVAALEALLRAPLPDNKALTVDLPGEAINARYGVADMLEDFKKEAEFSDHSVGINGITWAESALLAAIIAGLNVGRPPEKGE